MTNSFRKRLAFTDKDDVPFDKVGVYCLECGKYEVSDC